MGSKKQNREKRHLVKATLKVHELTKAGTSLELQVFGDGQKLGTMIIGQGSLTWFGGRRRTGREINWSAFAEMMNKRFYGDNRER